MGDVAACRRAALVLCAVQGEDDKSFAHQIIGWLRFWLDILRCLLSSSCSFHILSVGVPSGRRLIHICFVGWIIGWI